MSGPAHTLNAILAAAPVGTEAAAATEHIGGGAEASHAMLITVGWAIAAGTMLILAARRTGLPAIVLLLLGGILLGPEVLGIVEPEKLGDGLLVIVSLAVGLILFEGGLTLDVSGYRSAPRMIKRLLSAGVLITWLGVATSAWIIFQLPFKVAIIAGSLVIVTGPTVIAPLLKRIKVNERVHNILHWEGVLIDPLGVFIALLCYESFSQATGAEALADFGIRIGTGMIIGIAGGWLISQMVRRQFVPRDMVNSFSLGAAVLVFLLAELIRTEAGLLSVTVAGFVFGLTGGAKIKTVREFKAELTDLLIGTLFILLASRLEFEQFIDFGLAGALLVLIVMLVVRPLSVFVCSAGLDLTRNERLFLSWVAPRGIVAASMASLIAINFDSINRVAPGTVENPKFVETFTYSVIIATIVLQGLTAGPLVRWLNIKRSDPTGWLIVGANPLARRIASFLSNTAGLHTVLVDTNARAVREARASGLHVILGDARETSLQERPQFHGIGNMLALTDNEDLNVRLCQTWSEVLGHDHAFRCNPTGAEPTTSVDEDPHNGTIIWPALPKPSLLSGEVVRGEANLIEDSGERPARSGYAVPIVAVRDGHASFTVDRETIAESDDGSTVLYLERRADYLVRAMRPQLIMRLEGISNLQDLFGQMIDACVGLFPTLAREETIRELMDREQSFPTALGHGVAVPHAFSGDLDTRLCAVARIPDGVDFRASDGNPVRLVFMLLSPQGDPEGHLATLADIARTVIRPEVREAILKTESAFEVIETVRRAASD